MWLLLPELPENPVKGRPSRTVTVPLASKRFSFSQDTFRKFRNGTKIAWESFLNIRKWLPFRNVDHSIENFGGSRKDIPENLCLPYEVHLSQKFRKMLFHSPLEISGNSNRNFWWNGERLPFSLAWFELIINWSVAVHVHCIQSQELHSVATGVVSFYWIERTFCSLFWWNVLFCRFYNSFLQNMIMSSRSTWRRLSVSCTMTAL